jgi:hypothetical protein
MGSEIDPKDVERVMQAMKPLLEKSPDQVRDRKGSIGGGKGDQQTGRVVDWNAPSSREKGLRYEGHMQHKTPLVIGAFHDGRGNAKGLPPLVLDQGQFDTQKYAMSQVGVVSVVIQRPHLFHLSSFDKFLLTSLLPQWYGHAQQGEQGGHHGSLPTSARSNGTNASNVTSMSEGVAPRGKGGGGRGRARRAREGIYAHAHGTAHMLPRLKNLPAGVNSDGGRVSPILSVVADVDAIRRSEASPHAFHVDVLQRYKRGGVGSGPMKPRAPYAPKQPPYDAQQAVNLLRMERNGRPGGALRGYWKWGNQPGGGGGRGGGGSEGASVVRPAPTRVETEAERIAAVRSSFITNIHNRYRP